MKNEKSDRLEAIVSGMKERINLAIALSVDENHTFGEGEAVFREVIAALEMYNCYDTAAEQLINFSKVAYFRGVYPKSLELASEAVTESRGDKTKTAAEKNLHDLAYSLLETALNMPSEEGGAELLKDVEKILSPEDYCAGLKNAALHLADSNEPQEKAAVAKFTQKLAMEVLRQGIRREKLGESTEALKLLKAAAPFLNPRRAAAVEQEIERLEAETNGK